MYFGLFPEDHGIESKSLIRMWVAEGFIPSEDKRTMEEIAEDYLEELIQRSMIRVSRRYHNGSIKYCRIHDLMRDLAILKGRENRFLEIIPSQDGNSGSSLIPVRRAALHCARKDIMESTGPNLRSLLFFGTYGFPLVERFKLLKILSDHYHQGSIESNTLKKMVQLRYIALGNISELHSDTMSLAPLRGSKIQFWRNIVRMRNLETLHISSEVEDLRLLDCIWDIKTLRHVILPPWYYGPPSTAHLPNLQTLKLVKVRVEWLFEGWPSMPNIRVLKLLKFPSNYGESFCTFLRGLPHLTSLHVDGIFSFNWESEMWDMSVFPWYNHLQSLVVTGEWTNTKAQNDLVTHAITTSSVPMHLIKLRLERSKLQEDPWLVLAKLQSLQVLYFGRFAYEGKRLSCSARGFPRLQFLNLCELRNLEEWKADVAEGAMPMLKEITIRYCPQLRHIPGLQHMTSLARFTLTSGSAQLSQSLREDESHRIRDGQSVDIIDKDDDIIF